MTQLSEYRDAVDRLVALQNIQTPWEHSSPKSLRDSLVRMRQLLRLLGNPHHTMRFVHVTGTSGKGSVTNLVHDMLLADNRHVASYTSPHTTTLLERFRVGEKLLASSALVAAIDRVLTAYQRHIRNGRQPMTFFELSTCVALVAFADAAVTWCVLEVGLGGRWDSTNIIPSPAVAIITNIDLDHTHVLGNSREKIAHEKAGIIKKGSHVVTGEQRRAVRAVLAQAAAKVGAEIEYVRSAGDDHRLDNALVATRAALAVGVPMETIERALARHRGLPCRLETLQEKPRVIIDGAHNPAKMAATVASLPQRAKGSVHVVFGCKETKDAAAMLRSLAPVAASIRTTRYCKGPGTAHNPAALLALVPARLRAGAFLFAHDALYDALQSAKANDTVLVTGSLYLAGEVRTHWVTENVIVRQRSSHPPRRNT